MLNNTSENTIDSISEHVLQDTKINCQISGNGKLLSVRTRNKGHVSSVKVNTLKHECYNYCAD